MKLEFFLTSCVAIAAVSVATAAFTESTSASVRSSAAVVAPPAINTVVASRTVLASDGRTGFNIKLLRATPFTPKEHWILAGSAYFATADGEMRGMASSIYPAFGYTGRFEMIAGDWALVASLPPELSWIDLTAQTAPQISMNLAPFTPPPKPDK